MKILQNTIHKSLLWGFGALLVFSSCDGTNSPDTPQEQLLQLTASSDYIVLDEELIDDVALTFTWTAAKDQGDDYRTSYLTKFDLADNDFSSPIRTEIENGVFSVSYTHGELQRLLTNNWYQPVNKEITMTFRIIGSFDGPKYILPEVDDVSIVIKTYGPQVIEASGLTMNGSAVPGGARLSRTLENQYIYAYYGQLNAGTINFPINADGATVISPASEAATLPIADAEAMEVRVKNADVANSWEIPTAGNYRVVIDLEQKTTTIYSEANDLKPMEVYQTATSPTPEPITAIYAYGEPTNWAWSDEYKLTQSIANPNIWIFNSKAISGRTKFGVAKNNVSFVFSCAPVSDTTAQDMPGVLDTPMTITGGFSSGQRNSYFGVPAGTNFIVLDLNSMMITFSVK